MPTDLLGKRYKLNREIFAVEDIDGTRRTFTLSAGEIIKVVAEPESGDGMVDVLWNTQILEVFAVDVQRDAELTD